MKKFDIDHIFIEIIIWSLNIKVRIGYESNNGIKTQIFSIPTILIMHTGKI